MKGAGAIVVVEVVLTVTLSGLTVAVLLNLPTLVQDLAKLMELGSAEAVAYDLAGLTSISAAAPDTIQMNYQSSRKDLVYSGSIKDRIVTVEGPFKEEPYKQVSGRAKVAIDVNSGLPISFQGRRSFTVKKTTTNGENKYEVLAS